MYEKFVKRLFDILISLISLIILSPLLIALSLIGIFAMSGNPYFVQKRPGKNERIFSLIKFRTMNNNCNDEGELLESEQRITAYGRLLRKTSLDELPELINVLIGDMSIVGPRPLLIKYLPLYNDEQKHRHDVRPGLTGLAQVRGRNSISWEKKFEYDVEYSENISFKNDIAIIFNTFFLVLKRQGIGTETSEIMEEFKGTAQVVK